MPDVNEAVLEHRCTPEVAPELTTVVNAEAVSVLTSEPEQTLGEETTTERPVDTSPDLSSKPASTATAATAPVDSEPTIHKATLEVALDSVAVLDGAPRRTPEASSDVPREPAEDSASTAEAEPESEPNEEADPALNVAPVLTSNHAAEAAEAVEAPTPTEKHAEKIVAERESLAEQLEKLQR